LVSLRAIRVPPGGANSATRLLGSDRMWASYPLAVGAGKSRDGGGGGGGGGGAGEAGGGLGGAGGGEGPGEAW
jgi:DNA polymerase-3 subunit gamma/tau